MLTGTQVINDNDDSVFSDFLNRRSVGANPGTLTPTEEIQRYFTISSIKTNTLKFWADEKIMCRLKKLALNILSVPASSAPVERAFSVSGFIVRPHRSKLSADAVSQTMFLKCNGI